MFRPSAAPRWKSTTRRFLPVRGAVDPYTARVRKLGTAAVPTRATAPPFRNALLVIAMTYSKLFENLYRMVESPPRRTLYGVPNAVETPAIRAAARRSAGNLYLALLERCCASLPVDRSAD